MWILFVCNGVQARSFQVNYSPKPNAADLLAFDLSILQPTAAVDLVPGHALGHKYLAYVSLVEVNSHASYMAKLSSHKIPLTAANPQWDSRCVDVRAPAWEKFLIEEIARPAVTLGFDGFLLDTADSIALLAKADPKHAAVYAEAVVTLVKHLRKAFPQQEIILNRGFALLPQLGAAVDGVLVESVFQTFTPEGKYVPVAAADHQALVQKIAEIKASGHPVYVLDYLPQGQASQAQRVAEQIRRLGAEPFLSTKELHGLLLGSMKRQARKI